ncbi:hypothetical protein BLA29_011504 [Euroglyphus maynei]|uniref:Uncharacterized protein n=1 Tax=Euroglyphus maynei TaxID=6958 RepID=A0A1Y3AP43_EURMA|nr:hypothetical protein BLA29_011504 [Euroglyphus maynei]
MNNGGGSVNNIVDSYIEKLMKRNRLRSNSTSLNMKNAKSQTPTTKNDDNIAEKSGRKGKIP